MWRQKVCRYKGEMLTTYTYHHHDMGSDVCSNKSRDLRIGIIIVQRTPPVDMNIDLIVMVMIMKRKVIFFRFWNYKRKRINLGYEHWAIIVFFQGGKFKNSRSLPLLSLIFIYRSNLLIAIPILNIIYSVKFNLQPNNRRNFHIKRKYFIHFQQYIYILFVYIIILLSM